jgi:hypothetical protein
MESKTCVSFEGLQNSIDESMKKNAKCQFEGIALLLIEDILENDR